MKAISFTLSGKTAHFKRPDVNTHTYFTYNHIHKVALMGLLGAVIGLKGYSEQEKESYPDFFEKLRDLKISIVPLSQYKGVFSKKTQVFNNSVGYASKEQGNNLIVREQWLENVCWKIYISAQDQVTNNEVFDKLEIFLCKGEAIYIPYLGKNDHPATIADVEIIELEIAENPEYISSLFVCETIELDDETLDYKPPFMFKDIMPVSINKYGMYEFEKIGYTNQGILKAKELLYQYKDDIIAFL